VAGGWEIEQAHVPGSYRMLGIWALSGVTAVVVTNLGAWWGDLHAGMYAGAGIGTLGILGGAAVYRRLERSFALPDTGRWSDGMVTPGRLADHLDDVDQGEQFPGVEQLVEVPVLVSVRVVDVADVDAA
jgi:hypothetical protein